MKRVGKILIFSVIASLTLNYCTKDNGENLSLLADFSASKTVINVGESIDFFDKSEGNPTKLVWNFAGGTPSSSTTKNPNKIVYNNPGTYNVTLTISKGAESDTKTKVSLITVTAENTPVVSTLTPSSVTSSAALTGGSVTYSGSNTIIQRGVCWSVLPNPTISNSKTDEGSGTGSFVSGLTGLSSNTTYYIRAYATNSTGTFYGNEISFKTSNSSTTKPYLNSSLTYGKVVDIDGNEYATIQIGNQVWMAENLKTTRYNDGRDILNITISSLWSTLTIGGWCYYNNNSTFNNYFGKLYNWHAVNYGKLCPIGWHIPSEDEWYDLFEYLDTNIGGKMKSTGVENISGLWRTPNLSATNSSGFSGHPGGNRSPSGFINYTYFGYWWSSTQINTNNAYGYGMYYLDGVIYEFDNVDKRSGLSCRCVKD